MKFSTVVLALLAVAIWGFHPAVGKLGLLEIPPFAFLTIRYTLISLIFLPFARPTKKELVQLFFVAMTSNVIYNAFCYFAYTKLSPSAAILLLQTEAPIAILMACLLSGEKINWRQALAIFFAFCGVIIVLGVPKIHVWGALAILGCSVSWGICLLIFKETKGMQIKTFLAYSYFFALPFVAFGAFEIEHYNFKDILGVNWNIAGCFLFYEVVLLSVANVVWRLLVAENGINKIAPFGMLTLVFGIIGGVLIFDDKITWHIVIGGICVTLGVFFTLKEYRIIKKARLRSAIIYRNAHHRFMKRKLLKNILRKTY